jgi:hypothetical protein
MYSPFMSRLGTALLVGGAAMAGVGLVLVVRSRRGGSFGRAAQIVGQTRAGGATLTHYRDRTMPIEKRVKIAQDLVWQGVQDPRMRKLALAITGHGGTVEFDNRTIHVAGARCPARDGLCEAKAIDAWTRKNIRYTGDIAPVKMGSRGSVEGIDLFQIAGRTIEYAGEDCDGHSIVNATLLALNGISPKFRVTARSKDGSWGHIYTMAGLPKLAPTSWVALDTTLPGDRFGVEAPNGKHQDFVA